MQVTLEKVSNLERKLNITVPAEQVANKIAARLQEIAAKAKVPGFRPGKVPFDFIKNNYGNSAHADVIEKLLHDSYGEALQQEKLNPAGLPKIDIITSKADEPFSYTATFEVYPEVKLAELKPIEVEKYAAEVTDSDVTEMLERMRKAHVTWQEITDPTHKAQAGDQLTVDLTVKPCDVSDDKAEANVDKDVKFSLGDGSMWADFEQPLYGVGIGEEKQFILQMPATHMDKALAGKRVEFTVKVHKLCEPILPVLDDEFAVKLKIQEGGIAKLREEVREHLGRELAGVLKDLLRRSVMEKLLEHNPFEIPKSLVTNELKRQEEGWHKRHISSTKAKTSPPPFPRTEFEPHALRNVQLGLLMAEIIKEHQLAVSNQEITGKVKDLISAYYYDDNEETVSRMLADEDRIAEIEAHLLEDKVIDFVAAQVKLIEKNLTYKEAIAKK